MWYRCTPYRSTPQVQQNSWWVARFKQPYPSLTEICYLNGRTQKSSEKKNNAAKKKEQAYYYNQHQGVKTLAFLYPGDQVLTKLDTQKSWITKAVLTKWSVIPQSYLVKTEQGGTLRKTTNNICKYLTARDHTDNYTDRWQITGQNTRWTRLWQD